MFKRWKSLGGLDRLRSRNGRSARPWLLAKLLLMALAQRLVRTAGPKTPDGRRHSAWSRTRVALDAITLALMSEPMMRLVGDEPHLARLCESPRRRVKRVVSLAALYESALPA